MCLRVGRLAVLRAPPIAHTIATSFVKAFESTGTRMTETAVKIPFPVSRNVARMQPSSTLAAMQAAIALRQEGHDVVDFGPGEPDFDTPAHIKEAAARAMRDGQTKYTPTCGTKKFQESVAAYYEREFGARVNPAEVSATAGGKQGIFNADRE